MECPGCRHANREGARFCGACGAPLPVLCPKCGAPNPSAASFCDDCGARLTGPAAAAAKPLSSSAAVSIANTAAAERRQLTVMFCDLVGSTGLSARLDLEDMRELIAPRARRCPTRWPSRFLRAR